MRLKELPNNLGSINSSQISPLKPLSWNFFQVFRHLRQLCRGPGLRADHQEQEVSSWKILGNLGNLWDMGTALRIPEFRSGLGKKSSKNPLIPYWDSSKPWTIPGLDFPLSKLLLELETWDLGKRWNWREESGWELPLIPDLCGSRE